MWISFLALGFAPLALRCSVSISNGETAITIKSTGRPLRGHLLSKALCIESNKVPIFISEQRELEVINKKIKQEGTLRLLTRISIRGNYRKGPVPVTVKYEANFHPNEKYWEVDPDHPDEEFYPHCYIKEFDSVDERECYIKNDFKMCR